MYEATKVEKPWGYELLWAKTDRYVAKIIHINSGHALSLQYHNHKDETILLWKGRLTLEIKEKDKLLFKDIIRAFHQSCSGDINVKKIDTLAERLNEFEDDINIDKLHDIDENNEIYAI